MYQNKRVGVVIPAYNEEQFIEGVIETVPTFVDRVYVVDDGSTDGTWEAIQRAAERLNRRKTVDGKTPLADGAPHTDRIVPIQHPENRGVGNAIKTGYLRALEDDIDATAVMGGDGQMDPDLLEDLVKPVVEGVADYTKGNRLLNREYREEMPTFRLFGNSVLTFLTKIVSGYWKMMDPQNGYTCISKEALERVDIEKMYGGYGYCNDLLVRLNARDVRIADVAMPANYGDEESDIQYTSYIRRVSRMLFSDFLWRLRTKYLVLDFHPLALFYIVGAALCVFGVGGGTWSIFRTFTSDAPLFVRVMASLLVFANGVLFLLLAMLFDMLANQQNETQCY